ncbi:uncharacterized protein si:dkeyp-97a10.2 [Engraulis encrasicolus]|uniref:uncharacterized protein si:dkeyp-97a10.2 n=1 Tax=Engraulis encrasicolus TaxID=184585 RepID=UPI002FD648AC
MELRTWLCFLVLGLALQPGQCVSVHFLSPKPLYVAVSETLVLRTEIDIRTKEAVPMVTWEHLANDTHSADPQKRVTVAAYPGNLGNKRVVMEEQGAVLKISNFGHADAGVYIINVTDHTGYVASAQHIVAEYLPVYHVSVMVNVSHTSLHCKEAWGTEPVFSWFHDLTAVERSKGRLSSDNTTLYVQTPHICGTFTCTVSNRLGYSSASYKTEPCERSGHSGTVAVVFLFLLLIVAGVLLFLLWRRQRVYMTRGERLREDDDSPL